MKQVRTVWEKAIVGESDCEPPTLPTSPTTFKLGACERGMVRVPPPTVNRQGQRSLTLCPPHPTTPPLRAVVMDTKLEKGVTVYKIHFQGWRAQHDSWVPLNKVLQLNEENLIRMDELYGPTKHGFVVL